MAGMIKPISNVYDQLRRLPGLGSKTALRLAYHVIDMDAADVERLAATLIAAKQQIHLCQRCFNFTDRELCEICTDSQRDQGLICVVEEPQDVLAMEPRPDLLRLVEDELLMAIPLVPMHEDCPEPLAASRGQAAADAHEASVEERPNPFAALAHLKK